MFSFLLILILIYILLNKQFSFDLTISQKQAEEHDIILTTYYPDGRDSMSHTLDILEDLKDENELKFNKKNIVKLKTANSANPVNVDKISVANK